MLVDPLTGVPAGLLTIVTPETSLQLFSLLALSYIINYLTSGK